VSHESKIHDIYILILTLSYGTIEFSSEITRFL